MNSYDYIRGITAESEAVFVRMFDHYMAMGSSFDGAMQSAIIEEQRFIEECRREAARKGTQN